ncbi:5-formyltetrahydrofolate cyclo-ligase [Fibrella sp. WM1]|uniref:5-formyltetrahydrofolate cyclo-ligase n=1 Tax=Fibrella musci TaxID=3242485 RepID=UPI003521CE99
MTKAEIRQYYKARRAELSPDDVAAISQQLADRFFADDRIRTYLNVPDAVLHTYLPIRRQNEVDSWPIIRRIWAEWSQVVVLSSITDPATHTLTSFRLTPDTILTENRWGIPEPEGALTANVPMPTLVLVPLLAFDTQGHRVGYGGGYYDRFLAQLPPTCPTIGLSFFPATPRIDAVEPTDVPLAACVEPMQVNWWAFISEKS